MPVISINNIEELTVEPTTYCNLHCPQCNRFTADGYVLPNLKLEHFDVELFKRSITKELLPSLRKIIFQGEHGDIVMHPQATELIKCASEVCDVTIYTNGSLRSEAWWKSLAKIKNLTIIFSIDGLEDTNHLYRINSNFDKIIKNAQSFISNGGTAIWKFIVFKHNQHQLKQAEQLAYQLGFKNFEFNVSTRNFWKGLESWPVYIDGKFSHTIDVSNITTRRSTPKTHLNAKEKLINNNFCPPVCSWAKNKSIYLNVKGHLLPCCMVSSKTWMNDMTSKLWMRIVGNIDNIDISKHPIQDILNGDFYQHALEESWNDPRRVHHTCLHYCSK